MRSHPGSRENSNQQQCTLVCAPGGSRGRAAPAPRAPGLRHARVWSRGPEGPLRRSAAPPHPAPPRPPRALLTSCSCSAASAASSRCSWARGPRGAAWAGGGCMARAPRTRACCRARSPCSSCSPASAARSRAPTLRRSQPAGPGGPPGAHIPRRGLRQPPRAARARARPPAPPLPAPARRSPRWAGTYRRPGGRRLHTPRGHGGRPRPAPSASAAPGLPGTRLRPETPRGGAAGEGEDEVENTRGKVYLRFLGRLP